MGTRGRRTKAHPHRQTGRVQEVLLGTRTALGQRASTDRARGSLTIRYVLHGGVFECFGSCIQNLPGCFALAVKQAVQC